MELYENLAHLRKEAGLSQQDLAERLNVSRQTISKWELGTALPSTENLIRLSRLYGVPLDFLVGNNETRETESADAVEEVPATEAAEAPAAEEAPSDDPKSRPHGRRVALERILLVVLSLAVVALAIALAYIATRAEEPEEIFRLEMERRVIDLDDVDRFTIHSAP